MKFKKTLILASIALFLPVSLIHAKGDMSNQKPIEIKVYLGDSSNPYQFKPSTINLETGKLFRLKLINTSQTKHYFTSNKFASSIFTRKVQVMDKNDKTLAEVKGAISTVEVYPGQTLEWWFVPIKSGTFNDLHCNIKGHTEAGMKGKIVIR